MRSKAGRRNQGILPPPFAPISSSVISSSGFVIADPNPHGSLHQQGQRSHKGKVLRQKMRAVGVLGLHYYL